MERARRRGFTILELLVVISIIVLLAGMIMAVVVMVRNAARVAQTRAIMHGALVGVSTTAMRTNVSISPVEHPLANSLEPRSAFVRGETIAGAFTLGDAVDAVNPALRVADVTTIGGTDVSHVLWPSDRYCGTGPPRDCDAPMLFGMERRYLTIIGTGYGLHSVRRLPALTSLNDRSPPDGKLDTPLDDTKYPNTLESASGNLADGTTFEIEQKKLFDYIFGPEVLSELTAMGGIRTADSTDSSSTLICNNRLRSWGTTITRFDYNQVHSLGIVRDASGNWTPYRLRGPALYDAWGREILAYLASNGSLVFESAGKDGVFRWNPGGDAVFETDASADVAGGDDYDGSRDNLATGQR
jgi:prepilin-type N-terminal cleavage/methylation domain-containing protein